MPRYSIDTRTIKPGEVFVAIRGDRFDGHDFIKLAVEKGASGLVVEKDISYEAIPSNVDIVEVSNSTEYLAVEAEKRIENLQPLIIGVTGSVGKTTTKNAIASVLKQVFPVTVTQGNLNTLLGISLTVLNQITDKNQKFVAEVGTYQRGNISNICKFIKPSISVVTQIQPVHLETMGTIENITLAKGELVEALDESGTACLNYDDFRVRSMNNRCKGRVVYYGTAPQADVTPDQITTEIPLIGSYKVYPAMAAYCVGQVLGLSNELINIGLANLQPEKGRLAKLPGRNNSVILDDTYNASLVSTLASLDALKNLPAKRRIAILGDMLELGSEEKNAHNQAVKYASQTADIVILVGIRMQAALKENDSKVEVLACYETSKDAVTALTKKEIHFPISGDLILIKGSAGVRMEYITKLLLDPDIDPKDVLVRQEVGWQN